MPHIRMQPLHVAFALGAVAIGGAWLVEYLGHAPCKLCLNQRQPFYIGVPVLAGAIAASRFASKQVQFLTKFVAALIFQVSTFLALHHIGVEMGWWLGPATCSSTQLDTTSLDLFISQLNNTQMVSCGSPTFRMLGLSLAWWNLGVSFAIYGLLAISLKRNRYQ